MFKKYAPSAVIGGLALASLSSFAVIDVTAATTGVADASTAVLAVLFIGNCILMTVMTSSHVRQSAAFLDAPASAPADQ